MRAAACLLALSLSSMGLLSGCSSQIVLLPDSPDGTPTTVEVVGEQGRITLRRQGYALYTDTNLDVVYRVAEADVDRDFGPSLDAMRATVAAGLPELAHSYMVLLPHPRGTLGSLEFESADGSRRQRLEGAAEAAYIDGYPERPQPPDAKRLRRDFGAALDAMRETLKLQRSYLLLLQSPDGDASQVIFRGRDGETLLGTPGESLTLDGLFYDPDQIVVDQDFADSRAATRQILEQGLPKLAHSYAALLESPLGPVGEVEILDGEARGVLLDQAGQAVVIDGYSEKIYRLEETQYQRDFGEALAAMPPPPVTLLVYFDPGSARLTRETLAILPSAAKEIRNRASADVTITGHTDTVSDAASNEALSRQRAAAVAAYLRKHGAADVEMVVEAYGETMPAVSTADNKAELLNRRVEIDIR